MNNKKHHILAKIVYICISKKKNVFLKRAAGSVYQQIYGDWLTAISFIYIGIRGSANFDKCRRPSNLNSAPRESKGEVDDDHDEPGGRGDGHHDTKELEETKFGETLCFWN
jgi:hypothetical protein